MKPVDLRLPAAARTYNFLFPTKDPDYLVQDLLSVQLPGDFYIDVSWGPEHDPSGEYFVHVFQGDWDNSLFDFATRNLSRTIDAVESWARKLTQPTDSSKVASTCEAPADIVLTRGRQEGVTYVAIKCPGATLENIQSRLYHIISTSGDRESRYQFQGG